MEPIRILAFRELHTCRRGHTLDVWIRPRAPGVRTDQLRHCPHCETLFVLTAATQHSGAIRPALDRADDVCPTCQAPLNETRPYPDLPTCSLCATQMRSWLKDGPDLPASAATIVRGWALHDTIDLTNVTIPTQPDPATRATRSEPTTDPRSAEAGHARSTGDSRVG